MANNKLFTIKMDRSLLKLATELRSEYLSLKRRAIANPDYQIAPAMDTTAVWSATAASCRSKGMSPSEYISECFRRSPNESGPSVLDVPTMLSEVKKPKKVKRKSKASSNHLPLQQPDNISNYQRAVEWWDGEMAKASAVLRAHGIAWTDSEAQALLQDLSGFFPPLFLLLHFPDNDKFFALVTHNDLKAFIDDHSLKAFLDTINPTAVSKIMSRLNP